MTAEPHSPQPAPPPETRTLDDYRKVMVPNYAPADLVPVRGRGARVWTQDGREIIDFGGGIAVNSLGHCHPELVAALQEQARQLWHVSNMAINVPAVRLAEALCAATFAERAFFCNSGAEANEAALKLARRHAALYSGEQKHEIVSFRNAFHGRTLFTVTVGGQARYCEGFGPLPGGIRSNVPFNDVAAAEAAIGPDTCAVIVEPVQGEGGVNVAEAAFLIRLRELCDEHGACLVFDEVQSGVGRTGALYAYMQTDVIPDILTTAKGLGGGFPVGAMLTRADLAASLAAGSHGTTYGGNPLACAVAGKVIELVSRPEFLAAVRARGAALRAGLEALCGRYPQMLSGVRGSGMLLGAVTAEDWRGKAGEIAAAALKAGVWCLVAGPDVVRFAPPLVLDAQEMEEGLERLGEALADVAHPM